MLFSRIKTFDFTKADLGRCSFSRDELVEALVNAGATRQQETTDVEWFMGDIELRVSYTRNSVTILNQSHYNSRMLG